MVDAVVPPGQEIDAAEAWILGGPEPLARWDRESWEAPAQGAALEQARRHHLANGGAHFPALAAIMDCIQQGLSQSMDDALASEIEIFAQLIQRSEARNMIATLFHGRIAYSRAIKQGQADEVRSLEQHAGAALDDAVAVLREHGISETGIASALRCYGFAGMASAGDSYAPPPQPARHHLGSRCRSTPRRVIRSSSRRSSCCVWLPALSGSAISMT